MTEKIHGTSFRFQLLHSAEHLVRESQGNWAGPRVKFGSKNIELNLETELHGKSEFYSGRPVKETFKFIQENDKELDSLWFLLDLPWCAEISIYGEWAGDGCLTEIRYGPPKLYVYMIVADKRVLSRKEMVGACELVGFSYVHEYVRGKFTIDQLLEFKHLKSVAKPGAKTEGVIIAVDPPEINQWGELIICKDKNEEFAEEKAPKPADPEKKLKQALAVEFAQRFVTPGRIGNIISHGEFVPLNDIKDMKYLSYLIPDDIHREELAEWNSLIEKNIPEREIRAAIVNHTAAVYKEMLLKKTLEKVNG